MTYLDYTIICASIGRLDRIVSDSLTRRKPEAYESVKKGAYGSARLAHSWHLRRHLVQQMLRRATGSLSFRIVLTKWPSPPS